MGFSAPNSLRAAAARLACALLLVCAAAAAQTPQQMPQQTPPSEQPSASSQAAPAAPAPLSGTSTSMSPQRDHTYTLHVYADLVEIPTLVLSPQLGPVPPIAPNQFEISLDAGPPFHPTHVQLEGSEPINLSILLDLNGNGRNLVPAFESSLPSFLNHELLPNDRLSLFAVRGSCIASVRNLSTASADRVGPILDTLLHPKHQRGAAVSATSCKKTDQLWNAIGAVALSMKDSPGHRVILVMSDGQDRDSTIHWQALRDYCDTYSITIFGLAPAQRRIPEPGVWTKLQYDPFSSLAQLSGGLVLYTMPMRMQEHLSRFIELVRGRYILEFPAPDHGRPGEHSIDVKIADTYDFVRPSGIAFVPPDPSLSSAPDTVAAPPSPAVYGDHPLPEHPQ